MREDSHEGVNSEEWADRNAMQMRILAIEEQIEALNDRIEQEGDESEELAAEIRGLKVERGELDKKLERIGELK